ncbi:MAG: glycosyltransferase family 2 protein, partial [Oscillospiraceae bacterium]|nr:glycosyltransferase family 2 protein [Oscillospiraceae bacterium]
LKDFKEALELRGFEVRNEYLIPYAIDILHRTTECDFAEYKSINKTIVSDILRCMPYKEIRNFPFKKRVICTLYKTKQFLLLGGVLKTHRRFKKTNTTSLLDPKTKDDFYSSNFRPLVSVIVPAIKDIYHLLEAINSVVSQTYDNIEIIVVSNGKEKRVENLISDLTGIVQHFLFDTGNIPTALNLGLSKVKGEYFVCLMPNHMFYPTKIEHEIELLQKCRDKDSVILSGFETIDEKGYPFISKNLGDAEAEYPKRRFSRFFHILVNNVHSSSLFPSSCIETTGVYDPTKLVCYNQEFLQRVLINHKCKLLNKTLLVTRMKVEENNYRYNIEYSQLVISILDMLTDKDISLMWNKKMDFYLSMRNICKIMGWTIAFEYVEVRCLELDYTTIHTNAEPDEAVPLKNVTPWTQLSTFRRFLRILKERGFFGTAFVVARKMLRI